MEDGSFEDVEIPIRRVSVSNNSYAVELRTHVVGSTGAPIDPHREPKLILRMPVTSHGLSHQAKSDADR